MEATRNEHARIVRLLILQGAGIDFAAKNGQTALHVAAASGDLATAKLLLAGGGCVSVYMADNNGFTPLMAAAQEE